MTIEKKSLISTLKTTKKANLVKDELTGATVSPTQKMPSKVSPSLRLSKAAPSKKTAVKSAAVKKLAIR
jgi:hypothetical protein